MRKGDVFEGTVEAVLFPNKGILHEEDWEIVVKNTIPGQKIRYRIKRKKNGRADGDLLEVLEQSQLESREAGCTLFPQCGGCSYRTLPYAKQLRMKEEQVRRILSPVVENMDSVFGGVLPSPEELAYRNKMEYTFGDSEKDGPLMLGLHKKGSIYDVLPAVDCCIVHEDMNQIVACVQQLARESGLAFYHKRTHVGYFRHLLVRRATITGEILIDLVTTTQSRIDKEANCAEHASIAVMQNDLFSELKKRLLALPLKGKITGILHTVNDSVADIIRNDGTDIIFGKDYFYEELLGLRFKITPFSFFQTNSRGAEELYKIVRTLLGDVSGKIVFDLYSGTGTITQMLAPVVKKAVGVEIVVEAVKAAWENAALNNLDNCEFIAGDVLNVIGTITQKPDVIVIDPPRDGIHPKALPKITEYNADKIIYISCKPTSLARDLPWFQLKGYRIEKIVSVDMFPGTVHVETVVLMTRNT